MLNKLTVVIHYTKEKKVKRLEQFIVLLNQEVDRTTI